MIYKHVALTTMLLLAYFLPYKAFSQVQLGIGPIVNISKSQSPQFGYQISLMYYIGKKKSTEFKYFVEPIDNTRDRLLSDSTFSKAMSRFIDIKINERLKKQ
jgi:hypothetical protein